MPRAAIYEEISKERRRQDRTWGGNRHDDDHEPHEWAGFINHQSLMGLKAIGSSDPDEYRRRMVNVAALAVAAIEAHDRMTK